MAELTENVREPAALVREYIKGTHGSLPNVDYERISSLLSDNFILTNEEQRHSCESLLKHVFPGWASIVEGNSEVRIHSIATCENHVLFHSDTDTVLANWETDYDCKDDSVWYGTDVVLTGKKVRNFQVFASFTIRGGKIIKIDQRSDSVIKKLGIEAEVLAYRAAQGSSDS